MTARFRNALLPVLATQQVQEARIDGTHRFIGGFFQRGVEPVIYRLEFRFFFRVDRQARIDGLQALDQITRGLFLTVGLMMRLAERVHRTGRKGRVEHSFAKMPDRVDWLIL